MKDADNAPSPNRFCRKLGMRNAALQASASASRPKKCAMTRWRTSPARRLKRIPSATKNAERRGLVNVLVDGRGEGPAGFFHQVRLDELIDVPVEHAVDVADLLLRPEVLDELIRLQHVAANLAAERDLLLRAANLIELRLILFQLQIVEARFQDLH